MLKAESSKVKAQSSKFKATKTYMVKKSNDYSQMKLEEQMIQKFSYRCPYCDQPISYENYDLKVGENEIQCPSCKKIYIKVVSDPFGEGEKNK
jgi:rubrerythrin